MADATISNSPRRLAHCLDFTRERVPCGRRASVSIEASRVGIHANLPQARRRIQRHAEESSFSVGSRIDHCEMTQCRGKTQRGQHMSEAAAQAAGNLADHGQACP